MRFLISLCACLFLTAGCNLIYKQNIQQGNALEQEDLDQLELGMTKNQVSFLLGTPAIHDPFHQDRWDYVSTFSRRGGQPVRRLVTLEFENDRLAVMQGVKPSEREVVLGDAGAETVAASATLPGVAVEDARDYEDLSLVPAADPNWSIQVGSFSSRAAADSRLAALRAAGIAATIFGQVLEDTGYFIVRTGSYASREEALAVLAEIEANTGFRPFLVSPSAALGPGPADWEVEEEPPPAPVRIDAPPEADSVQAETQTVAPAPVEAEKETPPLSDAEKAASLPDPGPDDAAVDMAPEEGASLAESIPPAAPTAADRTDAERYLVQVGSFVEASNADNLVGRLREAGYSASRQAVSSAGETSYKVRIGPLAERSAAETLAAAIKQDFGIDGFVISAD